jgi:hypothetical protein
MTCTWQPLGSNNGAIERPCGKEGDPFCPEHQLLVDVLDETESVTSEICEHREAALTQWREEIRRFRLLVAQAEALPPAAFVKRVHEVLPELRRAGMEAAIYTYIGSRSKEE